MFSKLKFVSLFFVFIMVCLTPAFATEMSEKAQTSEDYYNKAKNLTRHQIFEKIKMYWDTFGLLSQIENTPRDSPGVCSESSDAIYDKALVSQDNVDLLLNYRGAPVKSNDVVNKTNGSVNDTNITNNTSAVVGSKSSKAASALTSGNHVADVTYYKDAVAPQVCSDDAMSVIQYFASKGIALSKVSQKEVDESLIGNVAQFVDKKGYLRYVYVKNVRNNTVTFVSNDGKSISMSAETFAKGYTGILLVSEGSVSPESLINSVNNMQKEKIDADTQDAQNTKNSSYTYAGIGGAFLAVGLIVLIIGLIITSLTANFVSSMSRDNSKSGITGIIKDPRRGGQFYNFAENMNARTMFSGTPYFTGSKLEKRDGMLGMIEASCKNFNINRNDVEDLKFWGVTLTSITTLNAFIQILAENWVLVFLLAIGVILALAGIFCLAATIPFAILAVTNWVTGDQVLFALDQKRKDRDEWLNMVNETNSNNVTNATNATNATSL